VKRRDVLKNAGALMLGATAVRASAFADCGPDVCRPTPSKDLVVAFAGPFCFWWESPHIKVMAPPVGPHNHTAPHKPWFGTSTNEKVIDVPRDTTFTLNIKDYDPPSQPSIISGTPSFPYEQQKETGAKPLFNLIVPVPNIIIGVRPTVVKMVCASGVTDPYCTQYTVYASGLSFVYCSVLQNGVNIKKEKESEDYFKPCFTNDDCLKDATLGVHLTPLDRHPDPGHVRAKYVWSRMLSMYPWMQKEITDIDFCSGFDPADCHFDPAKCSVDAKHRQLGPPAVGPGDDCEVPPMNMGLPGFTRARKSK
jgi:hypothetical protein